jgi:hypothetical protein
VLGVGLFRPWFPALLHLLGAGGRRAWWAPPTLGTLQYTLDQFFFTHNSAGTVAIGFYVVLGLILLGVALPGDAEQRVLLGLVAGCGILLPYFASFVVQPFYDPRYLVYGAVALYLFAARGLVGLLQLWRALADERRRTLATLCLAFVVLLVYGDPLRGYYADPVSYRPDVRAATASLLRQYRPGDVIAYDDAFAYLPAIWYAHQLGGLGNEQSSVPYSWVPASWVQLAPMRQVLLGRHFMHLTSWLPRGGGRLWMVSIVGPRRPGHPPRAPAWFTPPTGTWKLARSDSGFYRLLVQLYVRR